MAVSRELEKLQRRWQENPLGLTFAPLAEAYRKEGMYEDALELLGIGLSQHPNYVPAHIVRGRCYLDTRSDGAAQEAFDRVLELDPENVIAFKGLAEIAERAGRYPEAIDRLERLLEFDRSNEEARQELARLEALSGTRRTPPAESLASAPIPADEPGVPPPPAAPGPIEPAVPETAIVESAGFEAELYPSLELASAEAAELRFSDEAGGLEPEPIAGPTPIEPLAMTPEPSPEELDEAALEMLESSAEAIVDDAEAVAGVEAEPELVVTETMAELFLRQGHRELALAVYQQLAGREAPEQRILIAIERLRGELAPAAPPAPALPAYSAAMTGGQSVRAFFEQLLAATRPGSAEPSAAGPSLGAVFGDLEPGPAEPAPVPPPVEEPGPSFDEFYADEATASPSPSEPGDMREPDPNDLEGFTSWLKGLKR